MYSRRVSKISVDAYPGNDLGPGILYLRYEPIIGWPRQVLEVLSPLRQYIYEGPICRRESLRTSFIFPVYCTVDIMHT